MNIATRLDEKQAWTGDSYSSPRTKEGESVSPQTAAGEAGRRQQQVSLRVGELDCPVLSPICQLLVSCPGETQVRVGCCLVFILIVMRRRWCS